MSTLRDWTRRAAPGGWDAVRLATAVELLDWHVRRHLNLATRHAPVAGASATTAR
ncbi:MAG: hypothetical protein ACK45K_13120 [Burkholderiaceae bacterium]